jgi:hypothetical protein
VEQLAINARAAQRAVAVYVEIGLGMRRRLSTAFSAQLAAGR